MKTRLATFAFGLLFLAMGVIASAAEEAPTIGGTWGLNNWNFRDSVNLKLSYRKGGTRWEWGTSQDLELLHGLTGDQLHALSTPVKFTLEHDAGVFFFDGTVMVGVGRGSFRFAASPSFMTKLQELGYDPVEADDTSLMLMAVHDISLAYAAEVKHLGLKSVAIPDLVRFRDHGIDLKFIRGLVVSGAAGMTGDDVVRLHDHGIDPPYIARVRSAGFHDLTVDQIVELHDHGID